MPPIITTPIFYVNARPHIGHAYTSVLADAGARWLRLTHSSRNNNNTNATPMLISGTDEHGQKISQAAGSTLVMEFCTTVSASFQNLLTRLHVHPTYFVRTTEAKHTTNVQAMWKRLRNHIKPGVFEGWYSTSDETFMESSLVDSTNKCLLSNPKHKVEWVSEETYLFSYDPHHVAAKMHENTFVLPSSRRAELENWTRNCPIGELQHLSVSRPSKRVPWAIPVPDDDTQSIYVWLDALTSYITGAGLSVDPDPSHPPFIASQANSWPPHTHVIGKDILRFHGVYWPAFLLAAGMELPQRIVAHAHWTVDNTKMSKSLGNVVDPIDLLDTHCGGNVDALRYFLLRDGRLEHDADFVLDNLFNRANVEIANEWGNLWLRATSADKMWTRDTIDFLESGGVSIELNDMLMTTTRRVEDYYNDFDFARGLEELAMLGKYANAMFSQAKPWKETDPKKRADTIRIAVMCVWYFASLVAPIAPHMSNMLLDGLCTENVLLKRQPPTLPWRKIDERRKQEKVMLMTKLGPNVSKWGATPN